MAETNVFGDHGVGFGDRGVSSDGLGINDDEKKGETILL